MSSAPKRSAAPRRRGYGVRICSFASSIADLPRSAQRDPRLVLASLKADPVFSSFDASANPSIAKTMTYLFARGLVEDDKTREYPWTRVRVTEAGENFLKGE